MKDETLFCSLKVRKRSDCGFKLGFFFKKEILHRNLNGAGEENERREISRNKNICDIGKLFSLLVHNNPLKSPL